jgi:hypothetical protein
MALYGEGNITIFGNVPGITGTGTRGTVDDGCGKIHFESVKCGLEKGLQL